MGKIPSPGGDYGLHANKELELLEEEIEFPSPIGD